MIDDIVARLRNKRAWDLGSLDEMDEAADEIERLCFALEAAQIDLSRWQAGYTKLDQELNFANAKMAKCKDDLAKWVNHWRDKDPSDTLVELHDCKRDRAKMARDLIDRDKERDALRALLREAREVIDGTHIEQYVEPLAARIDAALNKGGGDE